MVLKILSVYNVMLSGFLKINFTEKTQEFPFVTLEDPVEPRAVLPKHPSDYDAVSVLERQTRTGTAVVLGTPRWGLEFVRRIWVLRILLASCPVWI